MEAGAAAGPAGGTEAPGADGGEQQGQQQQEQQQEQGLDAGLLEQLRDVPQTLDSMRQWMESQQQPTDDPNAEPAEQEPPDLSFIDPESPAYDPQQASQQLLGILDQQTQEQIRSEVEPLKQELRDLHTAREAEALANEFPELENDETADALFATTKQWVQAAGLPPEAASNMQVIRAVFMMGKAAELHNEEQSAAEPKAASLEGAGGASPGGTGEGMTGESIVGSGRTSPLPFR